MQQATKQARVGRNDPCPCGSGVKFKKCCMASEVPSGVAPIHSVDQRLVVTLMEYAKAHFDPQGAPELRTRPWDEAVVPLLSHWVLYHKSFNGTRVVDSFLQQTPDLTQVEKNWLEAQARTPLTIWQVVEVKRGFGFEAEDVFLRTRREVREISASRTLSPGTYLLGRFADFEEYTVVASLHPQPLTPWFARRVEHEMRSLWGGTPTAAALLQGEILWPLLECWDAAGQSMVKQNQGLQLRNTDDEPLEPMVLEFSEVPHRWEEAVEDALPGDLALSIDSQGASILRKDTVLARLRRRDGRLLAEVNSATRATRLKAILLKASFRFVAAHRVNMQTYQRGAQRELPVDSLDASAAVLAYKTRQYESWPDQPVPLLDGRTPREVATLPEQRWRVNALLEEMAHLESRLPVDQRYDFNVLWQRLYGS